MKKSILHPLVLLIILLFIGILTKGDLLHKRKNTETPKDNSLAIMVYDEASESYKKMSNIPKGDYVLNESKSKCLAGGIIGNYDSVKGTIQYSLISQDQCYVYFDVPKKSLILELDNYTFSWNEIPGTTKYNIYGDDVLIKSTTSTTKNDLYSYYGAAGTHIIKVSSVNSANEELFSENSVTYTIRKTEPSSNAYTYVYYNSGTYVHTPNVNVAYVNWINLDKVYLANPSSAGTLSSSFMCPSLSDLNTFRSIYLNDINYCSSHPEHCTRYDINEFSAKAYTTSSLQESTSVIKYDTSTKQIVAPRGEFCNTIYAFQYIIPGQAPSNWIYGSTSGMCIDINSIIYVFDDKKKKYKKKKLKDITYDDELLVWDFDKGCFARAKALWIMKTQVANKYNLLKFSDGSKLITIDQHRIFNKEKGMFTYPMTDDTPIGTTTFNAQGQEITLVSKEVIKQPIEYSNIITYYHINVFTNNVLTSCRLNNIYPIKEMKYVKDNRKIKSLDEFNKIDKLWYEGIRVGEQPLDIDRGNATPWHNIEKYIDDRKRCQKKSVDYLVDNAHDK